MDALTMVIDKGIFGIRLGFLMTEPVRKYHTNDKADNISKGTIGLKRVHVKPCAQHQQKLTVTWTDPCEANRYISIPS